MAKKMKLVHVLLERDLYYKLWDIVKARYKVPHKKFHIVLNEAIREYVKNHYNEYVRGK